MEHEDFEEWWQEIEAYAEQYRLSLCFVEEEFILDGEFIPIHLVFEDDHCFDFDER